MRIENITLTNNKLVRLSREKDTLFLILNGSLYMVKEKFSNINRSNPKVSLKYRGRIPKRKNNMMMSFFREFQPYEELRSSQ